MACDGVFDSEVKEDACGICQGDNSTCRHVVHNIERPLKRGKFLFVIPSYI